jgi:hypothetical protein
MGAFLIAPKKGSESAVSLPDTIELLADIVLRQIDTLRELALHPGRERIFMFTHEGTIRRVHFGFVKDRQNKNPHLRVREGHEELHIHSSLRGLWPAVRFIDQQGKAIIKDGSLDDIYLRGGPKQPQEWIKLGVMVIAAAFAAWLGVKLITPMIAALAVLALIGVVAGLFVVAGALTIPLVQRLREWFGWQDWERVRTTLASTRQDMERLLVHVASQDLK